MMIITTDTLRRSDGKDQSNRPNHQLKKKPTQREEPVSKRTSAITEHLRVLPVKLDEAQGDTHPFRAEGAGDHINKTTGWAKGSGTRCPRAKRRRQVTPTRRPESEMVPKIFNWFHFLSSE